VACRRVSGLQSLWSMALQLLITFFFVSILNTLAHAHTTWLPLLNTGAKNLYGTSAGFNLNNPAGCYNCHTPTAIQTGIVYPLTFQLANDFNNTSRAMGIKPFSSITQADMQRVMKAIENMDSDGDGFSNKVEFMSRSEPGIASSKPSDITPPTAPTVLVD
jgi:hypothetical protein